MGFDRIRIKENGKKHVALNRWNNVLVILLVNVITLLCNFTVEEDYEFVFGKLTQVTKVVFFGIFKVNAWLVPLPVIIFTALLGIALSLLVTGVFNVGSAGWFTKSIRSEKLPVSAVFEPFKRNYKDTVLMVFLQSLYIFLWMLLLIVPGIVKAYAYCLATYIKAENPNIPAGRCIEMSKEMMNGHKADMFILDLSFIGWNLLSALTLNILGVLYVTPYYSASRAFAYEEIKADAAARNVIDIREINPDIDMGGTYPEM